MMVLHRSWCQLSQSKAQHRLLEAPQDCRDFKIQSIHFFPVFARLHDVKMPTFAFYGGRKQATAQFYFSF